MRQYPGPKEHKIMTRAEVRSVDAWAINEAGIPSVVLMENAGRSCAEFIVEKLSKIPRAKVCIFCGTGNNGGDGYVIARHLSNRGVGVGVVICGDEERIKGDAKTNLGILKKLKVAVSVIEVSQKDVVAQIKDFSRGCDMLVDALFGTGLSGRLSEEYVGLIEAINAQNTAILSVDIPSGLDCDTGRPLGAAVKASWTVTFVAVKKGFASIHASLYTGQIFVASIGVKPEQKTD